MSVALLDVNVLMTGATSITSRPMAGLPQPKRKAGPPVP